MVRTLEHGAKASGGKAQRKILASSTSTNDASGKCKVINNGGRNPVCPRETPSWQKSITTFFTKAYNKTNRTVSDENKENDGKIQINETENNRTPESSDEEYDKQPTKKMKVSTEHNEREEDGSDSDKEKQSKKTSRAIIEDSD